MSQNIKISKPSIPIVLDMTTIVPRTYPTGSRFLLECPEDRTVLILEGYAIATDKDKIIEISAGDLVEANGGENVSYPVKVEQRLVLCVK